MHKLFYILVAFSILPTLDAVTLDEAIQLTSSQLADLETAQQDCLLNALEEVSRGKELKPFKKRFIDICADRFKTCIILDILYYHNSLRQKPAPIPTKLRVSKKERPFLTTALQLSLEFGTSNLPDDFLDFSFIGELRQSYADEFRDKITKIRPHYEQLKLLEARILGIIHGTHELKIDSGIVK